MGNQEAKLDKKTGTIIGSATTGVATAAGIGLMFLPPFGPIAGGVLLGAGISSGVNTAQQAFSKEEEFDMKSLGMSAGIGAATGVIAAPFAGAGSALATGVSSGAKIVI